MQSAIRPMESVQLNRHYHLNTSLKTDRTIDPTLSHMMALIKYISTYTNYLILLYYSLLIFGPQVQNPLNPAA